MKYKFKSTLLLALGLSIVSGSLILGRYTHLTDLMRGSLMGIGLAVEVLALGMLEKGRKLCVRREA